MSSAMVSATEIRWTLAPLPTPDVLTMSDEDLLVATLAEADTYRNLSQQGIHDLHDLHREHDRLRHAHHCLINDYRRLRAEHQEAA